MIRLFDILLSFLGLLFFSPFFCLIALLIRIDSPGGVFFRQKRVGRDSRDFTLFKFRTMRPDSDRKGLLTVGANDSRITRTGLFLRRYKIDELPQLINVLTGDMSMVGPRPEVRKYTDLYTVEQQIVLSVRPGITDYASVNFKNENEILAGSSDPENTYISEIMPLKISMNMSFINKRSLFNYFKIIILTFFSVLRSK
jgi:lipopolysaccharide/colanic/teichoic acid biosynthesis glycosyltransferase